MIEYVYQVEFTAPARKHLLKLDRSAQQRIIKAAELLRKEPRPSSARRLALSSELWRVRIGDYRIVYAIDGQKLLVLVVRVGHRSSVYRGIADL